MLRFDTILRDPVHGDIPLTAEEVRVLDTPEMQRLRNIRQLGTAYLVYPGAQHSRFEHSIGTAHLASRMIAAINAVRDREGPAYGGYDEHEERVVRLAALVHDATHLPFGHNIEDQTGLLPRHDVPERFQRLFSEETDLGRALRRTGLHREVLGILAPEAVPAAARPPAHWRALVSGTIDADMLDYLARDALYTGLKLTYDPRIFGMFRVERAGQRLYVDLVSRGHLKEALLSEVVRCLEARYYFSERVYYHHAKISSGALVAKAVEIALLEGAIGFEQLQRSTDAGLLDRLARARIPDPEQRARLRTFVEAYQTRRLPKRAAVYPVYANREVQQDLIERFFGAGSAEERRRVELRMGEAARFAVGREVPVLLYCPAGHMQLKSARLLVRWPGADDLAPLSDHADEVPRLGDLERSYQRLWKFYVLALTDDPRALAAVRELCLEEFPGAVNLLEADSGAARPD
ncbi:MAG: HD domain-containing protein [Planctomycetota bacterium]|nr:MAG: HD domain-containing protein [Planctomycetota bacterium]